MFKHIENLKTALEQCGYEVNFEVFKPYWSEEVKHKRPPEVICISLVEDNDIEFLFDAKTGKRI